MVPSVLDARERGVLVAQPPFVRLHETAVEWADGRQTRPRCGGLVHRLSPGARSSSPVRAGGGRRQGAGSRDPSRETANLWLVGYGEWTGTASATLIGVTRSARSTVDEVVEALSAQSR